MSIWRRLWSEGEADLARRVLTTPEDALSRKVALGMTREMRGAKMPPSITRFKHYRQKVELCFGAQLRYRQTFYEIFEEAILKVNIEIVFFTQVPYTTCAIFAELFAIQVVAFRAVSGAVRSGIW